MQPSPLPISYYKRYTYLRKGKEIKKTLEDNQCNIKSCDYIRDRHPIYCNEHAEACVRRTPTPGHYPDQQEACASIKYLDQCPQYVLKPNRVCFDCLYRVHDIQLTQQKDLTFNLIFQT